MFSEDSHISSFPPFLQTMKEVFAAKIPEWQAEIKDMKKMYGDKILGTCTVEQV